MREGALHECNACRADGLQAGRYCPDLGVPDPSGGWQTESGFTQFCQCGGITRETIYLLSEAAMVLNFKTLPMAGGLDDQDNQSIELLSIAIAGMRTELDG